MITGKKRIQAKTQTYIDEDPDQAPEFADACYICGDEGSDTDLLVCDNCDYKVAHLHCLGFKVVPTDVWNCSKCTELLGEVHDYYSYEATTRPVSMIRSRKRRRRRKPRRNPDGTLIKRVKKKRKTTGGKKKKSGVALRRWRKRNQRNGRLDAEIEAMDPGEMRSDDGEYNVEDDEININNEDSSEITMNELQSTTTQESSIKKRRKRPNRQTRS